MLDLARSQYISTHIISHPLHSAGASFSPTCVRYTKLKMADPFEVRMRFSSQLQHLNASVTSAQKAAAYALKYKDMDEDLHSCILEQLERVCHSLDPESRQVQQLEREWPS